MSILDYKEFKVGDTVRVSSPGTWADGHEGIVTSARPVGGGASFFNMGFGSGQREYVVAVGFRQFDANHYELEAI